jgi:glycosyltransferase involved in cell wall biosynthesis
MAAPEVTVVIPTRDRWELLSRALTGVLAQEEVVFEVVVVDDGSRDGTAGRVAGLGDGRVRCVSNPESLGVARARNRGIAEARGQWIAFLDDDDLWSPRKLTEQLAAMEEAGAAFVFSSAIVVDQSGRLLRLQAPSPEGLVEGLLVRNMIPAGSSNVVARADLLRELGGFDDRLHSLADWDLWIRLARAGPAVRCTAFHLAYLEHAGSMHTGDLDAMRLEFALLAEKHRAACAAAEVRFGGALLERAVAGHLLAQGNRWAAARAFLAAAARHREPELAARAVGALLGRRVRTIARRAWDGTIDAPEWLKLPTQGSTPS